MLAQLVVYAVRVLPQKIQNLIKPRVYLLARSVFVVENPKIRYGF